MNENQFNGEFPGEYPSPDVGTVGLGYSRMYMSKKQTPPSRHNRQEGFDHFPDSFGSTIEPGGMYPGVGFGPSASRSPVKSPWGSEIESLPALFDPKPEFDKSLLERFMASTSHKSSLDSSESGTEPDYDTSDPPSSPPAPPDSFLRMGSFRSLVPFSSGLRFGSIFGGSRSRSSHNHHSDNHHHHDHHKNEDEEDDDSCDSNESSDSKRHVKFAHPPDSFVTTTFSPDLSSSPSSPLLLSSLPSTLIPDLMVTTTSQAQNDDLKTNEQNGDDDSTLVSIPRPNVTYTVSPPLM